ncbi:mobilization protein, partial [Acinetobacter brisouii]|uniref:mobilization protein n=1 Tax=Acinetobacter brisouii TaxID=396323 RepID=UPI00148F2C15
AAVHASAYLLDQLDHLGNVRAGIEVLRGDATTFNAICDSSPHLWKYTSGVIAWSKNDAPTDEQIKEVLDDFEKHAFAGLEQSQYHLFAVLHEDEDGSKHIHVLVPRLDLHSGKSLNIAPPGHEKHFDSLRDYFNTKYQWSRPDDLNLTHTTQEPNYVAKLNAQAKNIFSSHELETLTKKQFCKEIDNYVHTLLKTKMAENRADIIKCIEQLGGIESIKQSKEFLTVTLKDGKKHRLKGDFYHEQFEIRSYAEHLRTAAESRPTANELAATLRDAERLRDEYRAKRASYNAQYFSTQNESTHDRGSKNAHTSDFERDRELITTSHKNANSELYGANRCTHSTVVEYRYIDSQIRANEHRVVFNINAGIAKRDQQQVAEHRDRQTELATEYSSSSSASNSEPKRTDRHINRISDQERAHEKYSDRGFYSSYIFDFNRYIHELSNRQEHNNNEHSKRNDKKQRNNFEAASRPDSLQLTEITVNENRNRSFFDRAKQLIDATKQLASRAKRSIDSTSEFVKEHLERLQRSRAELKGQNQSPEYRERSTENRDFKARTEQLFGAVTANISGKLEDPITNTISKSIESTGFKQHCQQLSEDRIKTSSNANLHTTGRHRESTLENLAIESTEQLLRRLGDAKQADQYAWGNCRQIDNINRRLERLESKTAEIRLKPKPAINFSYLRSDGYYPDYVIHHKELCEDQQAAFNRKNPLQLIDCIKKKSENMEKYINRASKNIYQSDYEKFEKIIKNDQRMLKYLQCEKILEPQNDHLGQQRVAYQSCLKIFENIKNHIHEIKNPSQRPNISYQTYEPDNKPKPKSDFDLGF